MLIPIVDRAHQSLNLRHFNQLNDIDYLGQYDLECPYNRQYILRMIVRHAHSRLLLPPELKWLENLIKITDRNQYHMGINHLCTYVTIRHGLVTSENDDAWHTDGFSTKITHLPEQNYIISSCFPTEYRIEAVEFPKDFNPLRHNVHSYLQKHTSSPIKTALPYGIYCLDPYNLHKRPFIPKNIVRTFVRISYTPIEIMDDNNTPNPLLPMPHYKRDGVEIRSQLVEY